MALSFFDDKTRPPERDELAAQVARLREAAQSLLLLIEPTAETTEAIDKLDWLIDHTPDTACRQIARRIHARLPRRRTHSHATSGRGHIFPKAKNQRHTC